MTWKAGGPLELFLDGVRDIPSDELLATGAAVNGLEHLVFGQGGGIPQAARRWLGLIDEVVMYDRVLTDSEIAELHAGC